MFASSIAAVLLTVPALALENAESAPGTAEGETLTLLVTSGLSGNLVQGERTIADLASTVRALASEARADGHRVLILDAGRTLVPYAESRHDGGATMVAVLEAAGTEVFLPAPMDFFLGPSALARLAEGASFPVLSPLGTEASRPLPRHTSLEVDGLGVELLSLVDRRAAQRMTASGWTVAPALDALEREELDPAPGSVRIAVLHGRGTGASLTDRDDLWRLLEEPRGIDIVFVPDLDHDLVVERTSADEPVVLVGRNFVAEKVWRVARVDVELERRDGRWCAVGARLAVHDADPSLEVDARLAERIRDTFSDFRHASAEAIPPDRPQDRAALESFILEAVRERAGAEVAILNQGVLRPVAAEHFERTPLRVEAVRRLLSIDQQLVVGQLTGAQLRTLVAESLVRRDHSGRRLDGSLRFAGLTFEVDEEGAASDFEVNGRSLYAEDLYRVVTNSFLAGGGDDHPILADMEGRVLDVPGEDHPLEAREDVVLPRLLEEPARSFLDLERRGLWRFGIDRLQLGFTGVDQEADDAYDDTSDARAGASDSLSLLLASDLRADQEWTRFRWENRLSVRFGLLEEEGEERSELDDDVRLEVTGLWTEASPAGRWLRGARPYAGLTFETELHAEEGDPRRDVRSLAAGLDWSTPLWPRLRLGVVARRQHDIEEADRYGVVAEARFLRSPKGRFPGLRGRLFAERVEDDVAALSRLDLEIELKMPIADVLELRPAYNFYLYEDSRLDGVALYHRFSLALAYSWSAKYQRR